MAIGPASSVIPGRDRGDDFRLLIEHMPGIVYVEFDEPGYRARYVSPRVQDVLGHAPERFTDDDSFWASIVHPDDLQHLRSLEGSVAFDRLPFSAEYRMHGGRAWAEDRAGGGASFRVWFSEAL